MNILQHSQTSLSRADLLRVLAADGEQGLEKMAFALGYAKLEQEKEESIEVESFVQTVTTALNIAATPITITEKPSARYFYVTQRIPLASSERQNPLEPPDWLKQAQPLSHDERPAPSTFRLPPRLPLTCWSRLWPFLRRALGQTGQSLQLDIPRVIRTVTQGEVLRRLPWRPQHRWSAKLCILLDYNHKTQPFREDFNALCQALEALHGSVGLEIRILHGEPGRLTRYRQPGTHELKRWQMPDAQTRLLILSDLGLLDASPETLMAWRQFGGQLRAAACKPVVLSPVAAGQPQADLQSFYAIFLWDRHSRFQAGDSRPATMDPADEGAERLLALAAPAIVIESSLLRRLRYLLPNGQATAADEVRVWSHPDIAASSQGCCFASPTAIARYQQQFQALAVNLQQQAIALIRAHHAGLPASIRYAELDVCQRLLPGVLEDSEFASVQQWKRSIVKTAEQSASPVLREWQHRHLQRHPLTTALWQDNPELAALWAIAQRDQENSDESPELPPEVSAAQVWYFLQTRTPQTHQARLCQRGQVLVLETGDGLPTGSWFADLTVSGGVFVRESRNDARSQAAEVGRNKPAPAGVSGKITSNAPETVVARPYSGLQTYYLPITQTTTPLATLDQDMLALELETATEILHIASLTKPSWAVGIGRDKHGLFADLEIQQVIQRFRWIAPGTFLMGSPETEPERIEARETQHQVTLTQGYWLADSASTQALWTAVMGDNPSRFRDNANNPVEQVSWNTVKSFIEKLNQLVPSIDARLPTEAEWEYACRAGTTTPFSFGDNITPEQVNYDGNNPYAKGEKGLYRKKTVPVNSLPPNAWGLYEMHGNVWEWCEDGFAEFDAMPQTDPLGPTTSAYRVLRGGSWVRDGRGVRSAYRSRNEPGYRINFIGFRLALGQTGTGEKATRREPGQPLAERRGGQGGGGVAENFLNCVALVTKLQLGNATLEALLKPKKQSFTQRANVYAPAAN